MLMKWVFIASLFILTLSFAAVMLYFGLSSILDKRFTQKTEGEIVSIKGKVPKVSFDAGGEKYTFESHYHSSSMKPGQKIPVSYNPANPNQARVSSFAANLGNYIALILGLITIAASFLIFTIEMKPIPFTWHVLWLLVPALLFFCFSLVVLKGIITKRAGGVKTEGVYSGWNGGKSRMPVITFKDNTGKEYSFVSSYNSNTISVGKKVPVIYNRNNPSKASTDTFGTFLPFLVLFYMGLGFLLFSSVIPILMES